MFGDFGDWVPPPPAAKASIPFTSAWYRSRFSVLPSNALKVLIVSERQCRYYVYNVKVLAEMASALYGSNSSDAITYRY
jgi:hypothetical protein